MKPDPYRDLDDVWNERTLKIYGAFTDHPVRFTLKIVAAVVALSFLLSLIGNATGIVNVYWGAEKAKLTVKPRVTQAVYGTDNALHNIAYFHDQCNTILADEQNARNAREQLGIDQKTLASTTDPIAQQQASNAVTQDESVLTGTRDQLSNDVRDYDSKSATYTANPFKANNLPYRITLNPTTGLIKGTVDCH